jgi:hypothetical protein
MNSIAGLLLANKLAAGLAVAVLATGATVGTFAAQDKLPGQSHGPSEASVTPRAEKGIPTDNPQHPLATGTCEKGQSVVKTTPAGTEVRVPCQAVEKGDNSNGKDAHGADAATARSGNSDRTPGAGDRPEGTRTPESGRDTGATAAAGAAGDHGDPATPVVPTPHSR